MSKYEKLDAAVLARLSTYKPINFTPLFSKEIRTESFRLAELEGAEGFRILDRRLQALRKSDKILYKRGSLGGWVLTGPVAP